MNGGSGGTPLLEVSGLVAHYGDFQALFGIDFTLRSGEIVAIIGANGAGKSTLLRTLTGLNACQTEAVRLDGRPIGGRAPYDIVRQGIAMVPEGRRLFPSLSVRDNLLMGARVGRNGPWTLQAVQELFPILAERGAQPSTTLSGGQQQMVAISRALMSNPRILLCDELSLGLAPTVIKDIYAAMPRVLANGCALVIVEQDIGQAMRIADRVYCLQEGRVSLSGKPADLSREAITAAYFGV